MKTKPYFVIECRTGFFIARERPWFRAGKRIHCWGTLTDALEDAHRLCRDLSEVNPKHYSVYDEEGYEIALYFNGKAVYC